jgi:hypothetical protein
MSQIKAARYFWIVSVAMVLAGITLTLGGAVAGLGAVALVCGILLLWSGIVKIIVLRIWRGTLHHHPSSSVSGFNDGTPTAPEPPR